VRIDPLFYGGPQEWGRRAGHEDIAAAVAFAVAIALSARDRVARASEARKQSTALRALLADLGGHLTGADERLPNFASCAFGDRKGEDILLALDIAGIAASSGSACASGSLDPSHVLLAMGLNLDEALGSLRLSTGYTTTDEEISGARDIIAAALTRSSARA
jgi:cysteine desulfurase